MGECFQIQDRRRSNQAGAARAFAGELVSKPGARRPPLSTAASRRRSSAAPSSPRLRTGERSRGRANILEASSLRIASSRMFPAFRRRRRLAQTFAGGLARQQAHEGDQRVGRLRLVRLGRCSVTRSHADRLPDSADGPCMAKSLSILQRGAPFSTVRTRPRQASSENSNCNGLPAAVTKRMRGPPAIPSSGRLGPPTEVVGSLPVMSR